MFYSAGDKIRCKQFALIHFNAPLRAANEYGHHFAEGARLACPLCARVDEISHCYFPELPMHGAHR